MRIGLQAWGSEGDVRPILALAHGLKVAGHTIECGYTSVEGRDWSQAAKTLGLTLDNIGAETLRIQREKHAEELEQVLFIRNPLKQVRLITDLFLNPVADEMYAASLKLCEANDVVVAHFLCHPMIAAARKTGKPLVLVFSAPAVPSRYYPPLGMPPLGPLNNVAWQIMGKIAGPTLLASANALRERHHVPTLKNIFRDALAEPALMLTAASPTLLPKPADWPSNHHVSGYLSMPDTSAPELSEEVMNFLKAGPPPVFMTFGSMLLVADSEGRDGAHLMLEAAKKAGCRAIIQAPWHKAGKVDVPPEILCVERVRHELIFPSCAAIVHHGGAGTTQNASIAGLPSVLVPYISDQGFWADTLHHHGMAPRAYKRSKTTPKNLAANIVTVLNTPSMTERARTIAGGMRQEKEGFIRGAELISALAH